MIIVAFFLTLFSSILIIFTHIRDGMVRSAFCNARWCACDAHGDVRVAWCGVQWCAVACNDMVWVMRCGASGVLRLRDHVSMMVGCGLLCVICDMSLWYHK
jgi:hypothetical protein